MSSPITEKVKGPLDQLLIAFHQRASHSHRMKILAARIARTVEALAIQAPRCLDIGCGDMSLAESLALLLADSRWTCIDIHPLPVALANDQRWAKYKQFDGAHIPFGNKSFSCAFLCDVLHHATGPNQIDLLREAKRTSEFVIVKDHFEYGPWSRQMLRLMDFVGNYGYGVSVPDHYFNQARFAELSGKAGLRIQSMEIGIDLYRHLPFASTILRREWQFIAVLN